MLASRCGGRRLGCIVPYWRLSGFYLFYFATLGALVPYWGIYLQSLGFAPLAIGTLTAILLVSRIVAPLLGGWIADHRGLRMILVRGAALASAASFTGAFFGTGFGWLATVVLLFSFFWNASLPMLEVTTMNHFAERAGAYGRVRLWGSVGFIASVIGLGLLIDSGGPWWVLPTILLLLVGIWLCTLVLPETAGRVLPASGGHLFAVVMRPEVVLFLLACFLMQASHGPYYTFYSIYLVEHGYSKGAIGLLWALGVACEIVVFLQMQRLLARFKHRGVLLASFLLAALRWLMIGNFPDHTGILVTAQTLHAASFGAFHASAIHMVHHFFRGRHQNRGQALYGSVSFGVGGVVGSLYSGYTWSALGPSATFSIAAALAGLAWLCAWVQPRSRRQSSGA